MPHKDKEKRKEYMRKYRLSNKDKVLQYESMWRNKNREKVREKNRRWKTNNPEKVVQGTKLYYLQNSKAINERVKEYNQKNYPQKLERDKRRDAKYPEKTIRRRRNSHLKGKFGITIEQYEQMLEGQGGVCDICKEDNGGRNFSVDHDHNTGKVRGLLCDHCNTGIGRLKENIETMESAILYLRKHR